VPPVLGLHHVTAIASDPQRNVDFYAGVLGLRLVKKTVNFDDPATYHLYYADEVGTPGAIMTFFPWRNARRGRVGAGEIAITSFSVLPGAIGFWIKRLVRHGIAYEGPRRRGTGLDSESVLSFSDPDGQMLELVGHTGADGRPAWSGAPGISRDNAIRGIHGVTLWVAHAQPTETVLVDLLGFGKIDEEGSTLRYQVGEGGPGKRIDVRTVGDFPRGAQGAGTVHHVAWSVSSDSEELALREEVRQAGLSPTPVMDRKYFRSVYFREPGGVLYEIATNTPGFMVDETVETLGQRLMLPFDLEGRRAEIEAKLPAIDLPYSEKG